MSKKPAVESSLTHEEKSKKALKIFGKKTKIMLFVLFVVGAFLVGFFAIKIFYVYLSLPVLVKYNAAYNLYIQSGNPAYFQSASLFAKNWFMSCTLVILGSMLLYFHKIIKEKLEKKYGED